MFSAKYCEGEFWASTSFLPRRSATVLMFSRTTMPSPPLDQSTLLVDARHDAAVARFGESVDEQRHHVQRAPADVDLAGGVGVAHRHRVVDQHQFDAEVLAVGRLPDLAGLEAVVGQDDRPPAGPHVQGEPHRVVVQRLVGRGALDRGQPLGRLEGVLLDRRDAGCRRWLRPAWPSCAGSIFASPPGGTLTCPGGGLRGRRCRPGRRRSASRPTITKPKTT